MDWQLFGRSTVQRMNTKCRVGISALALQPHAAVPLPPLAPEFRRVRRARLRRTGAEQFGYTDNCLGCANARVGRKQAVGHSEHVSFPHGSDLDDDH